MLKLILNLFYLILLILFAYTNILNLTMDTYRICVSHINATTNKFTKKLNLNIIKKIYLEIPNKQFIIDYSDLFGQINKDGISLLVSTESDRVVLGANIVVISQGIIYDCTKKRAMTYYKQIPPPPRYPPPRFVNNSDSAGKYPPKTIKNSKNSTKLSVETII